MTRQQGCGGSMVIPQKRADALFLPIPYSHGALRVQHGCCFGYKLYVGGMHPYKTFPGTRKKSLMKEVHVLRTAVVVESGPTDVPEIPLAVAEVAGKTSKEWVGWVAVPNSEIVPHLRKNKVNTSSLNVWNCCEFYLVMASHNPDELRVMLETAAVKASQEKPCGD